MSQMKKVNQRRAAAMLQAIKLLAVCLPVVILSLINVGAINASEYSSLIDEDNSHNNPPSSLPEPMKLTSSQANNNASNPSEMLSSPSFYANAQAQKFRVNVSNLCERNQMRVTIRFNKPFYGLIHTKDRRKKHGCFVEGNGEQSFSMDISFTLLPTDSNYCGVVAHTVSGNGLHAQRAQNQSTANGHNHNPQTLSVILVVRLHRTIEFSDDRYFLLSCANRCTKSDCSNNNTPSSQDTRYPNRASSGAPFRGLATSESIVSPILRSRDESSSVYQASNNLVFADDSALATYNPEACDYTLGLKFQWLVKLCWVLSGLLLFALCVAFFLCLTLNRNRVRGKQSERQKRRPITTDTTDEGKTFSNQVFYTAMPSNKFCASDWSSSATNNSVQSNTANDEIVQHNIDKLRESNAYLGKQQHRQLAGLKLVESSQHQPQVLGRSVETSLGLSSLGGGQMNEGKIKRRRSIGSSTIQLVASDEGNQQQPLQYQIQPHPTDLAGRSTSKLHSNQRAKSRSQTTIHYDQTQDPFKTVPFNYLNSGYLSDGTSKTPAGNLESVSTSFITEPPAVPMHSIMKQKPGFYHITDPIDTAPPNLVTNFLDVCPEQWPQAKLNYDAPNSLLNADSNNDSQEASQFDPQNSRQLIDLIQQKHRQQLAQANLTAATMHPQWPSRQQLNRLQQGKVWKKL